jgi:hypothetical protein
MCYLYAGSTGALVVQKQSLDAAIPLFRHRAHRKGRGKLYLESLPLDDGRLQMHIHTDNYE